MKKFLLSALTLCAMSLALVSCSTGPKDNAEKFLNSFFHGEYAKASELATPAAKSQLDMLVQFAGNTPDSVKKELQRIKIEVTDVKEEGDNATVTYTVKDPENKGADMGNQKLKMVKTEGKWLADWSKQDMMGGMSGGSSDGSMSAPDMGTAPATGDTSGMMAPIEPAPMEGSNPPAMGDSTTAPVR